MDKNFCCKGESSMNLNELMQKEYHQSLADCSNTQIYRALLRAVNAMALQKQTVPSKKKLYYLSAEFLIGKLLSNHLINLGLYDEVKAQLAACGKRLSDIEEMEPEPSLGNGGLGRLAACFLDSIATLGLPGDGMGLNYHFGLFRQVFCNHIQTAQPDPWLSDCSWLNRTETTYSIRIGKTEVTARMYDLAVTGYGGCTNMLHLFDLESVDEGLVTEGISFDQTAIEKNLTLFLYPDDSTQEGRILRIQQQYFLVSCAAQRILEEAVSKGCILHDLQDYAVIQINDTHPTMIIPELIRLLMERGLTMHEAIKAVEGCCAYTNHTILAEALETWPMAYLEQAVPALLPIIEVLDNHVRRRISDPEVQIIDAQERVHMAHIDLHYCFSVNGVASLHTQILKTTELQPFHALYPEKFNNKTNGITFRRWLLCCNPELTAFLSSLIGDGFKKNAMELKKLLAYRKDPAVLQGLLRIKAERKAALARWLFQKQGILLDETSIFDIQIKRLHEYKRQQLNALALIHQYLAIKEGKKPLRPITAIFGAKAAPAYTIAQDIIHLLLCLQELTSRDPQVSPFLRVAVVENYNVTAAEQLIPACDLSEQISLASKEASGTGNMKFMLNGAVTIGTEDGANVEIHSLVGDDNIYIFGERSDTVLKRYADESYSPGEYYAKHPAIRAAVDFITGREMLAIGDETRLTRLSKELRTKDWFMTFPDFEDYLRTRENAYRDYENRMEWAEKMLVNIAQAGYFSSDRTIAEYNAQIWKLCPDPVQQGGIDQ